LWDLCRGYTTLDHEWHWSSAELSRWEDWFKYFRSSIRRTVKDSGWDKLAVGGKKAYFQVLIAYVAWMIWKQRNQMVSKQKV